MGTRSVMSIPNPESWYTLSGLLVKSRRVLAPRSFRIWAPM